MNKFRLISVAVMLSFSNLVYAQAVWDMRAIANSSSAVIPLTFSNKTPYINVSVSDAKVLIDITDRYSTLSGIYPKIFLLQSDDLNASAGFVEGSPVIRINKPMYELLIKDRGAAAALIGHEMAHLYFRHSDGRAEARANAAAVGALIGTVLELLFIGRFGVVGLGTNLGSALSSGITGAYTRPQESEADRQGMIWAIQAGYDPNGSERLFTAFEKQNGNSFLPFLNSHPNPSDRIEAAKEAAALYGKYKNLEIIINQCKTVEIN
jgi:predicted Zn-dependent protease